MTYNKSIIGKVTEKYSKRFQSSPLLYHAPGRINLIGEHTDYNDGFVLPAAIDKAIYFAAGKNTLNTLRLYSIDYDESFEIALDDLKKTGTQWVNYLTGVTAQFQKRGLKPGGIDCVFGGDIPPGAGLSSSAALECGFALCLNDLFDFGIPNKELIRMAQKAEHEYAGVMCGIMDQFASVFGLENHVIKLDCRSLEYEYFPFTNNNIDIVLCDTKVHHSLASSEYNLRRAECERGIKIIKEKYPDVHALRDVKPSMLEEVRPLTEPDIYLRCHYVINETIRVELACNALLKNDFATFGKLMYETHRGLSNEYLVSCKELDILVDIARENPDVLGSRMMGGGFGGCTISLVKSESTKKFIETIKTEYHRLTGIDPGIYQVKIAGGAERINNY